MKRFIYLSLQLASPLYECVLFGLLVLMIALFHDAPSLDFRPCAPIAGEGEGQRVAQNKQYRTWWHDIHVPPPYTSLITLHARKRVDRRGHSNPVKRGVDYSHTTWGSFGTLHTQSSSSLITVRLGLVVRPTLAREVQALSIGVDAFMCRAIRMGSSFTAVVAEHQSSPITRHLSPSSYYPSLGLTRAVEQSPSPSYWSSSRNVHLTGIWRLNTHILFT